MIPIIAAFAAATIFALATALTTRKSAVHKHLAELSGLSNEEAGRERFSFFERLLDEAGKAKLEERLAEAGWYGVTPLKMVIRSVATTVEAGIALNGALASAVEATSGPLGEELKMALSDIRLGRSRSEALAAMSTRANQVDLSTTVTAMIQSEKLGGNIAAVLEELAVEARERRMMRAEEIAAQLPVKMVFPMVFFMLPALFVTIFGAVAADFFSR